MCGRWRQAVGGAIRPEGLCCDFLKSDASGFLPGFLVLGDGFLVLLLGAGRGLEAALGGFGEFFADDLEEWAQVSETLLKGAQVLGSGASVYRDG